MKYLRAHELVLLEIELVREATIGETDVCSTRTWPDVGSTRTWPYFQNAGTIFINGTFKNFSIFAQNELHFQR